MKQTDSLTFKIWRYLALFLIITLAFLWFLQVLFLKIYYEWQTKSSMTNIGKYVEQIYNKENNELLYDVLSYDNNICIEIYSENYRIYTSQAMRRGCIEPNSDETIMDYKTDFVSSTKNSKNYTLINPRLKNKTLVYAIKLDDSSYAFINASLEPMDSSIKILTQELLYVTFGVLISSFILAFFISKRISKPIINITGRAVKMAKGDYQTPFKTDSDIAEIRDLSDTLDHARIELSQTEETRKSLMANVSHDLKTPLTMIKAYAEMACDLNQNNKKKRTENLQIIMEEADRLNVLVNDILDLSKNESSIIKLDIQEFDIANEIKMIINRFNYLSETENYKFEFNCDNQVLVRADKQKITQVIYNLIINAINYTGRNNKVIINIEETKKYIRISIKDTGKGINKEDLPYIWDKYYKNEKNHKRNKIGTGLGLSIVKTILLNHGFKYGVNSIKGKGTTFYFDIKK